MEELVTEEPNDPWIEIFEKYGIGQGNFIEGDHTQPNYSFSFNLSYQETEGHLRFSWNNTINDTRYGSWKQFFSFNSEDSGEIYNGYTLLRLMLPQQKNKLKIYKKGIFHFLSNLHPHKVLTGSSDFDNTFITIAHPKKFIPGIVPQLDFLLDEDFGKSATLISDFEDPVTLKFYLEIRVNKLLEEEAYVEKLLKHTALLINKLNSLR